MHQGNREWLAHAQKAYGKAWKKAGVLELGSLNINGSAREYIVTDHYVGVDRVAGPGVDIVTDAEQTQFKEKFGGLVVTSILEHTPHWAAVIDHNLQWLKKGAIVLLSWGAEGNQHHEPEPWAPVLVGDVLEWIVARLGILEAHWEKTKFTGDCAGCYDIIAIRE